MQVLFRQALARCRRKGYRIRDPEYASAINWAVYRAMQAWREDMGASLKTLALMIALRECAKVRRAEICRERKEREAARPERRPPVPTPIPLSDYEVLSFVAAHGRTRAARMLGMHYYKLCELLADISRRIGPDPDALLPETYIVTDLDGDVGDVDG